MLLRPRGLLVDHAVSLVPHLAQDAAASNLILLSDCPRTPARGLFSNCRRFTLRRQLAALATGRDRLTRLNRKAVRA